MPALAVSLSCLPLAELTPSEQKLFEATISTRK
jgi:hypothetical protein